LNGVRQANLSAKGDVAVIGMGILGLITAQILKSGGHRVVAIDINKEKIRLAEMSGVDLAVNASSGDVKVEVNNFTGNRGVNACLITASVEDNATILMAENICASRGRIVLVGTADLKLTGKTFRDKELEFTVSRAGGHELPSGMDGEWTLKKNMRIFLEMSASNGIRLKRLITHRYRLEEAADCYSMLQNGTELCVGVIFRYSSGPHTDRTRVEIEGKKAKTSGRDRIGVGVIGGGEFAKNVLLPALGKITKAEPRGLATTTGLSSADAAEKFGFKYAATNYREVLADKSIKSVIIAAGNDLHAKITIEALRAGKDVLVEKPLCITEDELNEIIRTYRESGRKVMVGFNRRFSPLSRELKEFLSRRATPLVMNYRVNAGYLPGAHRVHDEKAGGGRIVAEACQFVDYLIFLAGSYPEKVYAQAIGGERGKYRETDNLNVLLKFTDGSTGSITFTAKGPAAFSKERLEVFCDESAAVLEDFRILEFTTGGGRRAIKKRAAEWGYAEELEEFLVLQELDNYSLFKDNAMSTFVTFGILQSLKKKEAVVIPFLFNK